MEPVLVLAALGFLQDTKGGRSTKIVPAGDDGRRSRTEMSGPSARFIANFSLTGFQDKILAVQKVSESELGLSLGRYSAYPACTVPLGLLRRAT